MLSSTRRFSNRVADYLRYRPQYPDTVIESVRSAGALPAGAVIADIGSGTGFLSRPFLAAGFPVIGIEPNMEMRQAGDEYLADFSAFSSRDGTAEATGLADASVDLITAGQAFHWFDRSKARPEFQRILRPHGHVALVWNERLVDASPFLSGYEQLLYDFCPEYAAVDHRHVDDSTVDSFFSPGHVMKFTFPHQQIFDFDGLRGRLLSSSYAAPQGQPGHEPMLAALQALFERTQKGGTVSFLYTTVVYLGRFTPN